MVIEPFEVAPRGRRGHDKIRQVDVIDIVAYVTNVVFKLQEYRFQRAYVNAVPQSRAFEPVKSRRARTIVI